MVGWGQIRKYPRPIGGSGLHSSGDGKPTKTFRHGCYTPDFRKCGLVRQGQKLIPWTRERNEIMKTWNRLMVMELEV